MGAQIFDRWRPALALLLPALGGLAYLAAFDAPARLIAVNAGALVLALACALWGRLPAGHGARLGLAASAAGALFLPLLTSPEAGGVARWFPLGPVQLHSGALLLPLLVVLAADAPRLGPALLALAAAALALQPDAASLAALSLAGVVLAAMRRSLAFALAGAVAAGLAVLTFDAGGLEPQLYTEGVLAHVAGRSMGVAVALGLLLFVEPLWHLVIPREVRRPDTHALAALLVGFAAMAVIAPFPFPLIGYGAAPILGFGLGIGALPLRAPAPPRFHAAA